MDQSRQGPRGIKVSRWHGRLTAAIVGLLVMALAASGSFGGPPSAQAAPSDLWSATLTVGSGSGLSQGFDRKDPENFGSLSDTTFSYDGTNYTIDQLRALPSSGGGWYLYLGTDPAITVASSIRRAAGLKVGDRTFLAWQRGRNRLREPPPMEYHQSNWSEGDTIPVSLFPPPEKPSGVSATGGRLSVRVSWDDPQDSTITKYQVRRGSADRSTWGPTWEDIPGSNSGPPPIRCTVSIGVPRTLIKYVR